MDFPKSVTGVGLVDGKFVDENQATGQVGSLIPSGWGNAVTEELLNVIQAAGLEPDEAQKDQLLKAVRKLRGGAVNFGLWQFSAAGGNPGAGRVTLNNGDPALASALLLAESSAEALDYSPSLGMLRAGDTLSLQERDALDVSHRFRVTGPAVDHGTYRSIPVSYVSGSGGAPAVDSMLSVLLTQNNVAEPSTDGIAGSFSNLKASATGANATVTVTADSVCVKNAASQQTVLNGLALAINSAAVGVNGLDAGVLAANTWYSKWVIYNPTTQAVAGLLSLSATAPTMPAGFTHRARVGWIRTDGTANKWPLPFQQNGRKCDYMPGSLLNLKTYPQVASGSNAGTFQSASLVNTIPPTAATARIVGGLIGGISGSLYVAPRNIGIADTNACVIGVESTGNGYAPSSAADVVLQALQIFYYSTASTGFVSVFGWEDSI